MLQVVFPFLVCLAWLAAAQTQAAQEPAGQALDEIIAGNLAAKGGVERLRTVTAVRQTSRLTLVQTGTTANLVVSARRPNLLRQDLSVAGHSMVTAFDGSTAWAVNPLVFGSAEPRVVTGPEAAMIQAQASFDSPFIDYQARGLIIEFVGVEELGGRRVHHLKLTFRDNQVQHCYLDADTLLEARIVIETPAGDFIQELSDYREVNGLMLPFSLKTLANGAAVAEIAVTGIEIDPPLDDAAFRMPSGG
jgi:hypothetical protein